MLRAQQPGRPSPDPCGARSGAAMVELAVCLPILIFVALSAMQAADVIFLKQTLHVASYEAARTAIHPRASASDAQAAGAALLDARDIVDYTIELSPSNVRLADRGETIVVTVSADAETNTVLPAWFYGAGQLTAETRMVKE